MSVPDDCLSRRTQSLGQLRRFRTGKVVKRFVSLRSVDQYTKKYRIIKIEQK